MQFRTWVENEIDGKAADMVPASAEVVRTGLQPQVGSREIQTDQKDEADKLRAIDGHMERIGSVASSLGDLDHSKHVARFWRAVAARWAELRGGDQEPTGPEPGFTSPDPDRVRWMKDNQPLPESPGSMAGRAF